MKDLALCRMTMAILYPCSIAAKESALLTMQEQNGGVVVHSDRGKKHSDDRAEKRIQTENRTPLTDFPSWHVLPPDSFVNPFI